MKLPPFLVYCTLKLIILSKFFHIYQGLYRRQRLLFTSVKEYYSFTLFQT